MEPEMKPKEDKKELSPIEIKDQIIERDKKLKELAVSLMPDEAVKASEQCKLMGIKPYVVQIVDDFFVFKTLKRSQWKDLIQKQVSINKSLSKQNEDSDMLEIHATMRMEEEIVIASTIWPQLDAITIKFLDAGQIETLANQIKLVSGFDQQPTAIKL